MIVGILLTAVLSLHSPAAPAPAATTEPAVVATAEACEADTQAGLKAVKEIDDYKSNSLLPEPLCSTTCNSDRVWCYLDPYFGTYLHCESEYSRCTFNCRHTWMDR